MASGGYGVGDDGEGFGFDVGGEVGDRRVELATVVALSIHADACKLPNISSSLGRKHWKDCSPPKLLLTNISSNNGPYISFSLLVKYFMYSLSFVTASYFPPNSSHLFVTSLTLRVGEFSR